MSVSGILADLQRRFSQEDEEAKQTREAKEAQEAAERADKQFWYERDQRMNRVGEATERAQEQMFTPRARVEAKFRQVNHGFRAGQIKELEALWHTEEYETIQTVKQQIAAKWQAKIQTILETEL